MDTQILSYLKLHTVNYGEKARSSRMVVAWIGFHLAQMCHLRLEVGNALQGHMQCVAIGNHENSGIGSTMPLHTLKINSDPAL